MLKVGGIWSRRRVESASARTTRVLEAGARRHAEVDGLVKPKKKGVRRLKRGKTILCVAEELKAS